MQGHSQVSNISFTLTLLENSTLKQDAKNIHRHANDNFDIVTAQYAIHSSAN